MTRTDVKTLTDQLRPTRHVQGGDFIFDENDAVATVWGTGDDILWASQEGLMIAGGVGAGKSTIVQQLVLHGIGVRPGPFLGFDVFFPDGVVGYVAADRPPQIRRSMRRMVTEADRYVLDARVDFWRGPLPFDLSTAQVGELADWVEQRGWAVIVIDSLKDVTGGMSADEDGAAINRQFQELLVRGIQLVVNHHDRKGESRVKVLDDVYGSRWLTAGFGSVLYVQGEAGADEVRLVHLKQPVAKVPDLDLRHDKTTGTTTVVGMAQIRKVRKPGQGKAEALAAVKAKGRATTGQVAQALGLDGTRQALNWLNELRAEGAVDSERVGTLDPTVWWPT